MKQESLSNKNPPWRMYVTDKEIHENYDLQIRVTNGQIRSTESFEYEQVQEENGQVTIFVLDVCTLLTNLYT